MTDRVVQFRLRGYLAAILWVLPVLLFAQAAVDHSPGERLRALISADWESAKPAPDRRPDPSAGALHNREEQDRARLQRLNGIPRNSLTGEDRTLHDLFEWELSRRLEQFRLRLYLRADRFCQPRGGGA